MELKLPTVGLIFIIVMVVSLYGCTNNQTSKTVKLNLKINEWSSKVGAKPEHKIKNSIVEIKEGKDFGPNDFIAAPESKPFKLLEIVDENNVKMQFDNSLVVVGEPIGYPSKQNPIIISLEETCFRTRSYDAGTDICLKIIK